MKKILTLLFVAIATLSARGASDQWRVFNTFDNSVEKVVCTPYYTYFLCNGIEYDPRVSALSEKKCYLYQYEKDTDELKQYNSSNVLSGTIVSSIDYDARHRKLYVIFDNGDIDILHERGGITRIKGLSMADISGSKNVNTVSFDSKTANAYLATDFGYVIVDGDKGEIESSFNPGVPLNAVTRLGDYLVIATDKGLMTAPAGRPHFTLDEFDMKIEMEDVTDLLYLGEKFCAVVHGPQGNWKVDYIDVDDDGNLELSEGFSVGRRYITHNDMGHLFVNQTQAVLLGRDRNFTRIELPEGHRYRWASSWDGKEFWFAVPRQGFYTLKASDGDGVVRDWTMTRDVFTPNSPSVMTATGMVYHPKYGVLVNPRAIDRNFTNHGVNFVTTLCGWTDGEWSQYSPAWLNPDRTRVSIDPNKLTIDKDNNEYVYMGSFKSGITRLNLSDPDDILHMTHPGDVDAGNPGYVKIAETLAWFPEMNNMQAPQFDADGNLWSLRVACDPNDLKPSYLYPELYGWSAANRKASVNAANFRPWTVTPIKKITTSNYPTFKVLTNSRQKTLILFATNELANSGSSPLIILDTKGTVDNGNDDTFVNITSFIDQDGAAVPYSYINDLYEDEATGLVWVASRHGVFTIDPTIQNSSTGSVNRIKVSRNDGTSLADYLLNGANVTKIISTPDGRKWFAIQDGGIVITTSDGRTILSEITPDNSDLPSSTVFDLCYNPVNNSMMISTDKGLAEYYLPGNRASGNKSSVRVYPNPVHPDYFGYVTIDGLEDNSLVKIMDSGGNIVKELGLASDGLVQWDVTNMNLKRVPAGVYFVLSSSGPDSSGFANVGKVLVVN